jgi:hypothetical protein
MEMGRRAKQEAEELKAEELNTQQVLKIDSCIKNRRFFNDTEKRFLWRIRMWTTRGIPLTFKQRQWLNRLHDRCPRNPAKRDAVRRELDRRTALKKDIERTRFGTLGKASGVRHIDPKDYKPQD